MNRLFPALLLLSLGAASAHAGFERRAWSRYNDIDAAPVAEAFRSGKAVSVELSEGLGHDTDRFGDDLRVIDQEGREVPYVLRPDRPQPQIVSASALNSVYRAGEQSFEIDTPPGLPVEGVELEIETSNFSRQAGVLSAAPGEADFRTVLKEGVLHRGKGGPSLTTLSFPPQEGRRLRIVIRGGEDPLAIRAIRLLAASAAPRRTRSFPVRFLGFERDEAGRRCSIRFELSLAYPADRLTVLAEPADFSREACLYRETPSGESLVMGGTLHGRKNLDGNRNAGISLMPLERGRYRLEVEEGDSPPLQPSGISLSGPRMFLVFRPASGLPHFLFHGRPAAKAPLYDLGRILPEGDVASALPASLAPEKPNPDFGGDQERQTVPERYPWLVRGAAILVALLLGGVAWRALKIC